jgi:acetyltransferase-like isoleucine patch superfamily enzyme
LGRRSELRKIPWKLRYEAGAKLASNLRRIAIKLTHTHCRVEFRGPALIGPGFALSIPDQGQLIIGPNVEFRRGFVCEIGATGRVSIGAGSIFTSHALIQCTTSIDIGKRAVFGQSLQMADGAHRFRDWTKHLLDQGYDFRPITIGDGAIAHAKCTIVADIGEGAIIGANSLVNKPIPPYCLAGGIPARVIEYFGPPERRPPQFDVKQHG